MTIELPDMAGATSRYLAAMDAFKDAAVRALTQVVVALYPDATFVVVAVEVDGDTTEHTIDVYGPGNAPLNDSSWLEVDDDHDDWLLTVTEGVCVREPSTTIII